MVLIKILGFCVIEECYVLGIYRVIRLEEFLAQRNKEWSYGVRKIKELRKNMGCLRKPTGMKIMGLPTLK